MSRKLKKNLIVSFSEGYEKFSQAPIQFLIWSAISAVGAVLKNKVYFKYGTYTLYPNQYIVLTAPPGIGKGEAMTPLYDMIESLNLVNIISDRITAAKIIERLASGAPGQLQNNAGSISMVKDSTSTLFSPELQILISSSDWMLQLLCSLWDKGSFYYDTKNCGSSTVKGICTSLIGACVPEYIRKLNKDAIAAINGGFTARSLFIYAEQPSKRVAQLPDINKSASGKQLMADIKDDLVDISQMRGEMLFSIEAQMEFDKFYYSVVFNDEDSDVLMHFKRRCHIHVIKLSMVFSASENDNLIISRNDMVVAIACIRHVMQNLDKAFRGVGESDLAEATSRVQDFIERKGLTTRNEILSSLHRHVSPENLDRILGVLSSISFIEYTSMSKRQMIKHVNRRHVPVVNTQVKNII